MRPRPAPSPATIECAEASLAEIDRAVDESGVAVLWGTAPASNPADDQATRLRALVDPPAQPARPRPSLSPISRVPADPAQPERTAKIVCVASGKGGVGKTNVAVNLAICLAAKGLRVTLLDADLGTANADVLCGVTPSARLDHVFAPAGVSHDAGRLGIRDILVDAPGGFRLVPGSAGISRMADLPVGERRALVAALADLESDTDVLVVDTAAGVGRCVTQFVEAADLCLVVTTAEPTSVADAYALIKCVVMNGVAAAAGVWTEGGDGPAPAQPRLSLVINQVADPVEARGVQARMGAVCERFLGLSVPSSGWIAQDLLVPEAVRARTPFVLRSPRGAAARGMVGLAENVAKRLGLEEVRPQRCAGKSRFRAAFERMFHL